MRVLFCGGGTAGHIYPNLALGETILKNDPFAKLAYVTSAGGMESLIVPYKKYEIQMVKLNKKSIFGNPIKFFKTYYKSIEQSKNIIKEFRPDIIIGTGGYASYPVILAGHKLRKKTILLESNLIPGKAIKMLENKVDHIFVNFEESINYFKNQNIVLRVGNPLREEYFYLDKNETKEKLLLSNKNVIVCVGGSLGAKKLNEAAMELIENYVKNNAKIVLIWGCGKKYYKAVKEELKSKRLDKLENIRVYDYIDNMPEVTACADVVISRAGAITISELSLSGKCAILVPSPNVANNHQVKNAKILAEKNGAVLITEDKLYCLTDTVKELILNPDKRKILEENIKKFSVFDSNNIIYKEIIRILHK